MKTFHTDIEIQAAPDKVWTVLTLDMPQDPESYGILRLEGTIALGARIKLWSAVAPDRAFSLKVTQFEAPNLMVWRGGMPFGLFVGARRFSTQPTGAGSLFQMQEAFSGPMAGLITKSIPDLTPSFQTFANALKQRAEQDD